jgi:DNA mismatch endonuclease, patch repair protein
MDRSENMRRIRSKGMLPELAVRRTVYKIGCRFRLHRKDLPGSPDLVFPSRHKVIFVNGCFWHSHGCKLSHMPKSNAGYWGPKLKRNRLRDEKNIDELAAAGWKSLVIWECETKSEDGLQNLLEKFLDVPNTEPVLHKDAKRASDWTKGGGASVVPMAGRGGATFERNRR